MLKTFLLKNSVTNKKFMLFLSKHVFQAAYNLLYILF